MLSLYTHTFLASAEEVLIYLIVGVFIGVCPAVISRAMGIAGRTDRLVVGRNVTD
jgi:hypothetical protein